MSPSVSLALGPSHWVSKHNPSSCSFPYPSFFHRARYRWGSGLGGEDEEGSEARLKSSPTSCFSCFDSGGPATEGPHAPPPSRMPDSSMGPVRFFLLERGRRSRESSRRFPSSQFTVSRVPLSTQEWEQKRVEDSQRRRRRRRRGCRRGCVDAVVRHGGKLPWTDRAKVTVPRIVEGGVGLALAAWKGPSDPRRQPAQYSGAISESSSSVQWSPNGP
jgi:hypothetical protein